MDRHHLGVVGNAQHATATTWRGMRPSFPSVVSPTLYPGSKAGLKHSRWQDYDYMMTDRRAFRVGNCIVDTPLRRPQIWQRYLCHRTTAGMYLKASWMAHRPAYDQYFDVLQTDTELH